ncbi:PREDICTED: frizzled-5-like [Acropora digitifera]|uniref:frizzled-5-like n=1 Tax=Acropora digitifera TaxID=70779 RepID=UPI00077A257B|nr:PREDICTED: frizzled-5-like [Acropora digitifera]
MTRNNVVLVLVFFCALCLVHGKKRKCEKIKIPMCQNIGYNFTSMPNMFNHDSQEEAALEVHRFWPLVQIKCSPDLQMFLCLLYAPLCLPNIQLEVQVPPCRSICKQARRGCARLMRKYGFSWPERMKCKVFPKMNMDEICIGYNSTTGN